MAEHAQDIQEKFVTKERNEAGIYLLSMWVNGLLTPVIVDDSIPSIGNQPAFA